MDKFRLIKKVKKLKENNFAKENQWNDRFFVKENHTPNKIHQNKSRAHIKIKSRDIKNINLNILTEEESNPKINITSNMNSDNKLLPINKSKLKTNNTLSNLLALKLHKKEKKNSCNNKHKNNKNEQNNSEIYKKIINLWDELGVNYIYQSIFNKICINLNKENRDNYYIYEYNKLNKIKNILNLIIDTIDNRDKKIFELQQKYHKNEENEEKADNNNVIGNQNDIEYDEETLNLALFTLTEIRKNSIDIINNIILLRKEIGYDILMNKYDINKILVYPNDYLVKMNNDLDFLIDTTLNKYFNFAKSDPFLIKINNNKYKLPKLKDENDLNLINNYEYLLLDELVNQEVNLMTLNSKTSFDSIFNFHSKNRTIKKNHSLVNNQINNNTNTNSNANLIKKKNSLTKIIKVNRGLSRQKLRPKVNNKIIIEADISNVTKNNTLAVGNNPHCQGNNNYINSKTISYNFKSSNKNFSQNEKSFKNSVHEEDNYNETNKYKNIKNKPINDDDLKLFEKFIEQSIMEKNNIDKEINKYTKSKNKAKKEENSKYSNSNFNNANKNINKKNENDEINNNINGSFHNNEEIPRNKDENSIKKQISNFIKDILEESEIEHSQQLTVSKNKSINKEKNKNINGNEYHLDNIEFEVEPVKKVYNNFMIELYKDKISSLKEIYKNYYKKIPEKLKMGFKVQSNIVKYMEGIYPKVLLIKQNNNNSQILGIVTLNYIAYNPNSIIVGKTKSNNYNKMLNISSISCINENLFEDILVNTIDFCQEFIYFEFIILQLYYLNKNGQFILYSDLEKIIKNKAKFRWINMENDGVDRKIKYRYTNTNYNINKTNDEYNNIICLKAINILGFETENNYHFKDIRKLSFINDFSINYILLEMIGQHNFQVLDKKNNGNNYINTLINKVTFKKMNNLCGDFLISQIGEADDIKNFIKENENFFNNEEIMQKIDERIFYERYFGMAMININNSFKNIIKRKYNGYLYNIILKDQINEFSIKDNNGNDMMFYLIKSSEQNTSIIVYEFKKNESLEDIKKLIATDKNVEKNISEVFKELFSKVTKKPSKINKNIYIPGFILFLNFLVFRPSVFSEIVAKNEEDLNALKINCLNCIEQLTFGNDEPFVIQQNVMDLDEDFKDNIIIQNDFILSIVDNDLIFELQIPTISTFLIKKEYWIKSS